MIAQSPTAGFARARRPRAKRGASSRLIIAGTAALLVLAVVAIAAPLLAPHDPEAVEVHRVLGAPNLQHPFGSDVLGRDVLSRVLFGLRVSLLVSLASVAASTIIAVPLGLLAGYFGRWVDSTISRTLDMILVLPAMLLAITFIAILGPGSVVAAIAIAVIYLPILARVMRTSTLVVTRNEYVAGARARGASHLRVLVTHVAPNALGPVIVQASVLSAFALQLEAGLSFLGLGTQPPTPSLGGMLSDGRDVLTQAPWVEIFPGLAIVVAVLAFTLLGEGLRRAFDPRGVAE
jgi:peptide/nickel transport system permease protein